MAKTIKLYDAECTCGNKFETTKKENVQCWKCKKRFNL